jgi:hypothetical protein
MTHLTQPDVHRIVQRFNQDEEVWRLYQRKRIESLLLRLRHRLVSEDADELAWLEAEAEVRASRCVGIEVP